MATPVDQRQQNAGALARSFKPTPCAFCLSVRRAVSPHVARMRTVIARLANKPKKHR